METITITHDMVELFRIKYNLSVIEIAAIFGENANHFYNKKEGSIINGLKNPNYVLDLMSDPNKLKARVKEMYENNPYAKKIYLKVFKNDEDNIKTKHYRDSWKVKNLRKAKYVRYIGNTKKVKAHYKDDEPTIPLINILEYSTKTGRPHVSRILDDSKDKIIDIIATNIQKEGK